MKEIKLGDKMQCIKPVKFCDGRQYNIGDIITVTEENIYYYQLFNGEFYQLIDNQ